LIIPSTINDYVVDYIVDYVVNDVVVLPTMINLTHAQFKIIQTYTNIIQTCKSWYSQTADIFPEHCHSLEIYLSSAKCYTPIRLPQLNRLPASVASQLGVQV
jgi:hypothetical protein